MTLVVMKRSLYIVVVDAKEVYSILAYGGEEQ